MATDPQFPPDPHYKAHYLHHRQHPPRWVRSLNERTYLANLKGKGGQRAWTENYQHQSWPQTRFHKNYSIDVERRPDVEEFFKPNGEVDEPGRQKALALRNKQRQRAVRVILSQEQGDKLGKDWMPYHELPAEKARLAQEAEDNAADAALYGGDEIDEDMFVAEAEAEPVTVMGEPLRRGRKGVAI